MEAVDFLFQLAIILFSTKFFGIVMRKLGFPQVLGFIIAGILIGPAIWGMLYLIPESAVFPIQQSPYLKAFSEVGVIFVMFSAGLETNLKDIKTTGVTSFTVAMGGVLLPLILGTLIGFLFLPNAEHGFFSWLFIGVIMTATSVGITVEVLKELGKLQTKVGTIVMSAAIIDDVLGVIVLSIALSLSGAGSSSSSLLQRATGDNPWLSIVWIILFFVFAIGVGIALSKLFKYMEKRSPHTRRIPIFSIAVCLIYAYIAERIFGVADITGAYIAGLILSTNHASAQYVDRKVTINSYTLFAPIFFASIGIKMNLSGLDLTVLWFAIAFVVVAIVTKIIGCGGISKLFGFNFKDSLRIGVGMIARGEVALIVMEKGAGKLVDERYRVIVVLLVLVSSLLAPILLKLLYKNYDEKPLPTKQELEEGHFE